MVIGMETESELSNSHVVAGRLLSNYWYTRYNKYCDSKGIVSIASGYDTQQGQLVAASRTSGRC
jgi:hypothetical protein